MNTIEWSLEGNSTILKLGAESLVELITQCETQYYALILTKPYAICCKYWSREMFTVTYKSCEIATLYHKKGDSKGNIIFNDKMVVNYHYQSKRGLSIFFKNLADDAIVYKCNTDAVTQGLSVKIGLEMTNLDIERLLLLLTLGKLLFDYFIHEEYAIETYDISKSYSDSKVNLLHLS